MKARRMWALVIKDLKEITKSKYILISIIVLPLVLGAVVPFQVMLYAGSFRKGETFDSGFGNFMEGILSDTVKDWESFTDQAKANISLAYITLIIVAMMPVIITAMIGAETIVGERERKTIEALLASPLRNTEIVTAKIVSSFIPSFIATIVSVLSFSIVMDIILYPLIGRIYFPDTLSLFFMFIISPLLTVIAIELLIMISTKISTVRDATQVGGVLLIPLMILIIGYVGLYFINSILGLIIGPAVLLALAGVFYLISLRIFVREKALTKLV